MAAATEQPFTTQYEPVVEPKTLRKFLTDGIYILGGQYAILMQFAHPGLARGSAEHSDFAGRILHRLKTTSRFLVVAVYGTPEEKAAITSVIHRSHAAVKGDGYFADDPELHKWTAATLFMALIVVHETFIGELSEATKRILFKESAIFATSLRMPPDMWPDTYEDFQEYWNHNVENLEVTDWARGLARDLTYPRGIPVFLRPALPVSRLLTAYWLPERMRMEYEDVLPDPKRHRVALKITTVAGKWVHLMTPPFLRSLPHRYYKRNMRKAVKRINETGHWSKKRK
ncbi:hypothetical protein BDW67DRAFT_179139 [Aspergillus spinulosporus]